MTEYLWQLIVFCLTVYFLSNVNYAVIISKLFTSADIRTVGSKNPGTTNMFRIYGLKFGAMTFVLDMTKGLLSTLGGKLIFFALSNNADIALNAAYLGGLMAVIGHVFPVFMRFKGGKGFACSIGMMLILDPLTTLVCVAVGIVVVLLTDRMSVFAMLYVTMQLAWKIIIDTSLQSYSFLCVGLVWLIVIFAHRTNIKRLIMGKEIQTGLRKLLFKSKEQ